MKNRKHTYNLSRWFLTIFACGVLVVGTLCVVLWPRPQGSEIYQHYKDTPNVKASFFKSYHIGDSVFVDVTMLESTDSAGWDTLKNDFGIKPLDDILNQAISNGEDLISIKMMPKFHDGGFQHDSNEVKDVVAVSRKYHSVSVFHVKNNEEKNAVLYHNLDRNVQTNNVKNKQQH